MGAGWRLNKIKAYGQLVLLGFAVTSFTPVAYQRSRLLRPLKVNREDVTLVREDRVARTAGVSVMPPGVMQSSYVRQG